MSEGRVVLVTTSPRVAPGLLSAPAWTTLTSADQVRCEVGHPLLVHLDAAGVAVTAEPARPAAQRAKELLGYARAGDVVVWLVALDGEPDLGRALGELVQVGGEPPLEVLTGSYDLPGARVLDLVATMDRLRSPGGCPWDAEQTHRSLTTYLVEEAYETLDAIETGDRDHLREELGDLLLQVVFHARIAAEHDTEPWTVDEVAADIVDKLVRRHPHVFGAGGAVSADQVETSWHAFKAAEKGRTSAVEGVPPGLPALALAAKLQHRAASHGVDAAVAVDDSLGDRLMRLVADAGAAGLDPEAELRAAARRFAGRVRAAEAPPPAAPGED